MDFEFVWACRRIELLVAAVEWPHAVQRVTQRFRQGEPGCMTVLEFKSSIVCESIPPAFSSPEARSLWYAKKGEWEKSHEIAQAITTPVGSWIHAMLHLMEGDIKNARYWFMQAGKPVVQPSQIDALWDEIVAHVLK